MRVTAGAVTRVNAPVTAPLANLPLPISLAVPTTIPAIVVQA